jgi:cysteine desulfuration protein SufE
VPERQAASHDIFSDVTSDPTEPAVPPSIERVLNRFRALGREEKMQALVQYAKKLEPVPERFASLDRGAFTVPECQTRVDLFPEYHDGKLHFYADVNTRQSPTIAAFLSILFSAINDQPPATTLAIPEDFVRTIMDSLGLGTREVGLNAMLGRVRRYAEDAARSGTERWAQ